MKYEIEVSENLLQQIGPTAARENRTIPEWILKTVERKAFEVARIEIEIPKRIWEALEYYIPLTNYWVDNEYKLDAFKAFIINSVEGCLEAEADTGDLARDCITDELKRILEG